MKKIKIVFVLIMGILQFVSAQPSKFPPVNDISRDKSLQTFVKRLKVAVQKKDKAYVLSVLDEKVTSELGEDAVGVEAFKKIWSWDKDTLSVWHHLDHLLALTGAYTKDPQNDPEGRYTFVFPYTYNLDLEDVENYPNIAVIAGKNVNLREKPDLKSKVLNRFSYDVVRSIEGKTAGTNAVGDPEWYFVESLDHKKKGWVFWKYLSSSIGYRLFLYKNKQGEWKISTFLAGD